MTIQISIDSQTEARLRRQAQAAGKDVSEFVSKLVEEAAARPVLDEVLAPLRRQFEESGTTERELIDQVTAARQAYRTDQSKKTA